MADPRVGFVAFTGSVAGGHAVQRAAAERFVGTGLELGGKDPAYVRADASLGATVAQLVDRVYFNADQSWRAIERIYVHRERFGELVEAFIASARGYVLGSPLDADTTLGPVVRPGAAAFVRGHVTDAVAKGARALIDPVSFPATAPARPTSYRRCASTSTMACG